MHTLATHFTTQPRRSLPHNFAPFQNWFLVFNPFSSLQRTSTSFSLSTNTRHAIHLDLPFHSLSRWSESRSLLQHAQQPAHSSQCSSPHPLPRSSHHLSALMNFPVATKLAEIHRPILRLGANLLGGSTAQNSTNPATSTCTCAMADAVSKPSARTRLSRGGRGGLGQCEMLCTYTDRATVTWTLLPLRRPGPRGAEPLQQGFTAELSSRCAPTSTPPPSCHGCKRYRCPSSSLTWPLVKYSNDADRERRQFQASRNAQRPHDGEPNEQSAIKATLLECDAGLRVRHLAVGIWEA